jgi:anti-sigma factor RsiW
MKCNHARKLFAAFWDDETTQAEREWLEAHFSACDSCRHEYESYARTLEVLGTLPRIEPAPDLAERALQRARRAETAPDRLPVSRPVWVPVTAGAAAMLLLTLTVAGPWFSGMRPSRPAAGLQSNTAVTQPVLVRIPGSRGTAVTASKAEGASAKLVASGTPLPDSLFDHSEDVEFVLDPVTLHRGRAAVTRGSSQSQGQRTVITF